MRIVKHGGRKPLTDKEERQIDAEDSKLIEWMRSEGMDEIVKELEESWRPAK